jgi:hypothetical protein
VHLVPELRLNRPATRAVGIALPATSRLVGSRLQPGRLQACRHNRWSSEIPVVEPCHGAPTSEIGGGHFHHPSRWNSTFVLPLFSRVYLVDPAIRACA